ncbi:unnamed protein product [Sphenostylis stenocarpa]|uniref:Uncharacterized protein n=1 Tax=Sphenostylis stenocarpa TaxID=92480 RepID=A0AA86SCD3_9FABA|nr:unnamed protein product [Sphenostylis stenocarpa]
MNHWRENSKVPFGEEELYTSPIFSFTLFSKFCPMFSTLEFNESNNARADEAESGNFNSFIASEDSSGYCDVLLDTGSSNEACGDESDEEVSLEELLLDGKTKEKVEVLAAMVGVETTDPATVLNEVVRVLKVLKRINQFQ